jgi:hypothetical protein
LEGCDQALVGQQWGVDAAGQVPQVIERGPEFVLELDCQLPDAVRVPGGVLQQAELDREGDELLLCPVVQVTFDLPPLGVLCFYQPAAGGSQLVDRSLQLGGELDVAQDEAGLRGQMLQELVLSAGQRLVRWFSEGERAEQLVAVPDRHRA